VNASCCRFNSSATKPLRIILGRFYGVYVYEDVSDRHLLMEAWIQSHGSPYGI